MIKFLIKILDFVYKKKCYFCGNSESGKSMCDNGYDKINPTTLTPNRIINGVKIYSACLYKNEMQRLIRGVKYHDKKELAQYQAKFMYSYFIKIVGQSFKCAVVPVPMHKNRQKKRKYNHMELVGAELCKLSGWELKTDLLYRIKDTKPQYKLHTKEREENLLDAFKVTPENYNGEYILLIDDIITTGSTMAEIIKTLKKAKITKIAGLTTAAAHFGGE